MDYQSLNRFPVFPSNLTERDREQSRVIETNLILMCSYVDQFQSALDIFDSAEAQCDAAKASIRPHYSSNTDSFSEALRHAQTMMGRFNGWKLLAARDGAMSIFHFANTLRGARQFGDCTALKSLIDCATLRQLEDLFRSQFPRFDDVRHAVGHLGELWQDADKMRINSATGPMDAAGSRVGNGNAIAIQNGLNGRTYLNTYKGRLLTYEVSAETLEKLRSIRDRVLGCFPQRPGPDLSRKQSAE